MAIEFDTINKLILLPDLSPTYKITAQAIYNEIMDWCCSQEAMDDDLPMKSTGFANLGGGAFSDKIFILQKGWKLKPYSGIYALTIIGTIIALDDNGNPYSRTVPPDSGEVQWIFQVTSQGIISVTGSGVTQQDKQDIADLIEIQTGQLIKSKVDDIQEQTDKIPEVQETVSNVKETVNDVENTVIEVQAQTLNVELHHIGRVKLDGDYLLVYDTLNQLIAKYKLVKDSEGRIIERIPEEI